MGDGSGAEASIETTLATITATQEQLIEIEKAAEGMHVWRYSDIFGQYTEVRRLQQQAKSFVGQSREAIDRYQALVVYLAVFRETVDTGMAELDAFNAVVDLNTYSGQADAVRETAGKLRAEAARLSGAKYPDSMAVINQAAVEALEEAADGFSDLADGLSVPADDPIYTAARRIENATVELEEVRSMMHSDSFYQSRAIKNIYDLDDKFDLLTGA